MLMQRTESTIFVGNIFLQWAETTSWEPEIRLSTSKGFWKSMYVPPISERSELLLGLPVKHKSTLFISSARKVEQINSAISLLSEMTVTFSFDLQFCYRTHSLFLGNHYVANGGIWKSWLKIKFRLRGNYGKNQPERQHESEC